MAAPRQKEMNERATVVATTTLADPLSLSGEDVVGGEVDIVRESRPATDYLTINRMAQANAAALARKIAGKLREHSHQAWLVGGCVRDLLLGHPPKDYDVATSAPPGDVLRLFPGADEVGAHFGVVLVHEEGAQVEVAAFRTEGPYSDGRRPDHVTFETDPRRDAERRDFTINAMMMDPFSGEVLDFAGGREDLKRRLIRTVGEPRARFAEDHLRMIRAVRFAARLGFVIEPATMSAIGEMAAAISKVAGERVREELNRILTSGAARRGFELLDESGLLVEILPEIAAMKGVEQPPDYHPEGDVWIHTLLMLERLHEPSVTLAWGVLLHDVGKHTTFRRADRIRFYGHTEEGIRLGAGILRRLRFSNEEMVQILALIQNHMRFMHVMQMNESTLKRFLRTKRFDEHLELHRVDCLASHGKLENFDYARRKLEDLTEEDLRPKRLLNGEDLMAAGYQPGPAFRRIFEELETAQLERRVTNKEEATRFVVERYEPPEGKPRKGAGT